MSDIAATGTGLGRSDRTEITQLCARKIKQSRSGTGFPQAKHAEIWSQGVPHDSRLRQHSKCAHH